MSTHSNLSLTLRVWDFQAGTWLPSSCNVEYRNTPLGNLYPDVTFAIGDVIGYLQDDDFDQQLIPGILDKGWVDELGQHWQLIGGSGSRKKGRCIYAVGGGDYFSRYFGSNSNTMNYGSNLTTECRKVQSLAALIKVVKDGEYGTGDCHAIASAQFCQFMLSNLVEGDALSIPFQFRAVAQSANWVAKGTIRYSSELDSSPYSLVLPESAFKGNKVAVGEYQINDLLFGVVHLAEVRRVKMSYSVTQFLPWSAIEADILPPTLKACEEINQLINSPRQLAEYLHRTESNSNPTPEEEEEAKQEYIPPLALVAEADKFGALVPHHPWVLQRIQWMLRSRWTRLATAGAFRFNSSMTQPDDSLGLGEVCIPGLPDGERVLVFPYPCRWKHDIAVWTNRALPQWQKYQGVIVASEATLLTLGRDSDGDFLQWLPAWRLPNVRDAVLQFEAAPALAKPVKEKVQGSLGEVAARAMNNQVGLITWAIAKAQAFGNYQFISELAQQLQIEVDSLKNVQRADMARVNQIIKLIPQTPPWLEFHKNVDAYIKWELPGGTGDDSISRLTRAVNKFWVVPEYQAGKLRDYQYLFPEPDSRWREKAALRLQEYGKAIAWAYQPAAKYRDKPVPEGVSELVKMRLRATAERFRNMLDKCTPEQRFQAACAFWHSSHWSNETTSASTSLVFLLCLREIIERLSEPRIGRFRLFAHELGEQVFKGEHIHVVQVVSDPGYPNAKQVLTRDGLRLGSTNLCIPDCILPVSIYTKADSKGQLKIQECVVLNSSAVEEF